MLLEIAMLPLVLTMLLSSLSADSPVQIIAHRGESADAPENTLAAFQLAWDRGADAIELDVHLTKDGQLICCHDADTKRTTGVVKVVKQASLAELQKLDAGSWKNEKYAGEKLPTLEAALATIPAGKQCFIEVKVGPEAVSALVKSVQECKKQPEQLVVISFNANTIAEAKRRLPELKMYLIAGFKKDKQTGQFQTSVDDLIAKAKLIKADGLDLSWDGPLDSAAVSRIREAGLGLYVWTVDDAAVARKFVALGVDGITTNKSGWLRKQLDKQP
jgi:glycerophosphoryl diester phosphodiesterase